MFPLFETAIIYYKQREGERERERERDFNEKFKKNKDKRNKLMKQIQKIECQRKTKKRDISMAEAVYCDQFGRQRN